MPASVQWEDDNKRVLIFKFENKWTLDEYYTIVNQANSLMDTVSYPVNMIIDIRKSLTLPNGFLSALRAVSKRPHPNSGKVALVGMSAFVRLFITMVRRLTQSEGWMAMVSDYEEAHQSFEVVQVV